MKIVRLIGNNVDEIIPEGIPYAQLAQYYNAEFASQCVEAPDEVEQRWTYNNGEWAAPVPEIPSEPDPPIETYLLDLDFRLSLIELGVI